MGPSHFVLLRFVIESNLIEGIHSAPGTQFFETHFGVVQRVIARPQEFISPITLHQSLLGWLEANAGRYREVDVWVGPRRMPKASLVAHLMQEWESVARALRKDAEFVPPDLRKTLAWVLHDWFLCIHPFEDGNGRVARLILNHCRLQLGLSWHTVSESDKSEYYTRIRQYEDTTFKIQYPQVYNAE